MENTSKEIKDREEEINNAAVYIIGKQAIRFKHISWLLIILTVVFVSFLIGSYIGDKADDYKIQEQEETIENLNYCLDRKCHEVSLYEMIGMYSTAANSVFDDEEFLAFANNAGAWYPHALLAQAKLESAHFTSNVFKQNNNLFGMKCAYYRLNCQTNNGSSQYGYYKNWQLSVIDRILWDEEIFDSQPEDVDDYIASLGTFYAEDSNYCKKLHQLMN